MKVPFLTITCGGLLEPWGSGLELLKATFNAENSICILSWSVSSHFGSATYSWNVCCNPKSRKKITITSILGFKVVQGRWSWCQSKGCIGLPNSDQW